MNLVFLTESVDKAVGVTFSFNGNEYFIHPGIFYSYVIALIIICLCLYTNYKIKRANPNEKPKGIVLFAEFFVNMINNFTIDNLGKHKLGLAPYFGMLAVFILISNISGLFGFIPPTSDYNVTLTLAIITIVMAQYHQIKGSGFGKYLKSYAEPIIIMVPNNVLNLLTTPLSMSLRLFGNVLAGTIILSLVYGMLGYAAVVVTPFLHAYFDLFAGGIQTFVFVLLTVVTIDG